ncbi:MAG: PPOX class F420-dependent oxidoreductase [Actinomycetota bacterium]|nr:PPOX class F420-dependent oxidoreductase [Actinomycetota bacterium]
MTMFSDAEADFLAEAKLARLATVDPDGYPHVVPVGFHIDHARGVIDIGGRELEATQKFRNVASAGGSAAKVGIVIDDVLPPWRPRCVMVRGLARIVDGDVSPVIRITPEKIVSWGLEDASTDA